MIDDIVESAGFVCGGVLVAESFSYLGASIFVGFCKIGVAVGVSIGKLFDDAVSRGGIERGVAAFEPVREMLIKVLRFSVD